MTAQDPSRGSRQVQPVDGGRSIGELAGAEGHAAWPAHSRVVLTPIAAPSITGPTGS
jgi:hypothetical protein